MSLISQFLFLLIMPCLFTKIFGQNQTTLTDQINIIYDSSCQLNIVDNDENLENLNTFTIECDGLINKNSSSPSISISEIPKLNDSLMYPQIIISLMEIKNKNYQYLPANIILDVNSTIIIISLSLTNDLIEGISKNAFDNLKKLEKLSLQGNKLRSIESGWFNKLVDLRELYLDENAIESIGERTFENMTKLEILNFNANLLKALPNAIFQDLSSLTQLILANNKFESVENLTSLTGLSSAKALKQLDLSYNEITSIETLSFINLTNVIHILFVNNKLEKIHTKSFIYLGKLRSLDFSYQNLKELDVNSISHCDELNYINLEYNQIETLKRGFLSHLKSLISLDISNNLLKTLVDDNFGFLENLNELVLSNNFISSIDEGAFKQLNNFMTLFLVNNLLDNFKSQFLVDQQFISLDKNKLSIVKSNMFKSLDKLIVLDLVENYITTIEDDAFVSQINLILLNLKGNKLKSISSSMFRGLRQLQLLQLNANQIESIEINAFQDMISLYELHLQNNELKSLASGTFNGLSSLITISLDFNKFTRIDCCLFQNMSNLGSLSISNNLMSSIDAQIFRGIETSLFFLDLSNNKLENMMKLMDGGDTKHFDNLTNLRYLRLNNVGLTTLQIVNMATYERLQDLQLNHNNIDDLDLLGAINFKNLENLYLQNVGLHKVDILNLKKFENLQILVLSDNDLEWTRLANANRTLFEIPTPLKNLDLQNTGLNNLAILGLNNLIHLFHLDVSHNKIEFISFNDFHLFFDSNTTADQHINKYRIYFYDLNLSNNWIKKIEPNSFESLVWLNILDLSGNALESQNDLDHIELSQFTNLLYLDVSNSNLTEFPLLSYGQEFVYILDTLILAGNKIENLSSTHFKYLTLLTKLDLHNNCIRNILDIGIFDGLSKLIYLNLSRNQIDDANLSRINFATCINLRHLNLSHNKIIAVRFNLLSGLNKLEVVDFSYNELIRIEASSFYLLTNLKSLYLFGLKSDADGKKKVIAEVNENFVFECKLLKFVYVSSIDLIVDNLESMVNSLRAMATGKVVNEAVYYNSINVIVDNFDYFVTDRDFACKFTILLLKHKIHLNLFSDFDMNVFFENCFSLDLF